MMDGKKPTKTPLHQYDEDQYSYDEESGSEYYTEGESSSMWSDESGEYSDSQYSGDEYYSGSEGSNDLDFESSANEYQWSEESYYGSEEGYSADEFNNSGEWGFTDEEDNQIGDDE